MGDVDDDECGLSERSLVLVLTKTAKDEINVPIALGAFRD